MAGGTAQQAADRALPVFEAGDDPGIAEQRGWLRRRQFGVALRILGEAMMGEEAGGKPAWRQAPKQPGAVTDRPVQQDAAERRGMHGLVQRHEPKNLDTDGDRKNVDIGTSS